MENFDVIKMAEDILREKQSEKMEDLIKKKFEEVIHNCDKTIQIISNLKLNVMKAYTSFLLKKKGT